MDWRDLHGWFDGEQGHALFVLASVAALAWVALRQDIGGELGAWRAAVCSWAVVALTAYSAWQLWLVRGDE